MTQPNFRDMVGMVSFWATAAKDHLEYEGKHGNPPLYPVLVCPFSQLLSVALMTLGFADSHWPTGVPGSKLHNDLFAMLRPIANQGGLNATVGDLTRIAELVEGILGGGQLEAEEAKVLVPDPKPKRRRGRPRKAPTVEQGTKAIKEDDTRREWSAKRWADYWKCGKTAILRSDFWKKMNWCRASGKAQLKDDLDPESDFGPCHATDK